MATSPTGIKANDGALWDTYEASGGKMINFGSVTAGADQVRLIAQAMTKAGTTDGSAVNTARCRASTTSVPRPSTSSSRQQEPRRDMA